MTNQNKPDQINQNPKENVSTKENYTSLKKQLQLYKDFRESDLKIKEQLKQKISELENKITEFQDQQNNFAANAVLKQKIKGLETEKEQIISQAEQARNEQAETIAELEKENNQLDQDLNKAIDLLESKDKTIKNLQKTIAELKKSNQNTENIQQNQKIFTLKNYSCQICLENRKGGIPSQFLRVKGFGGERNKKIWVCFLCRKQVVVIYDEEENWRNF